MSKPEHQCSTDYFACRPLPLVVCTLEHTVSDPTRPLRQLKKRVPESMPPRYNASLPVCRALPAIAPSGLVLLLYCSSSCSRGGEAPYRYKAKAKGTGQIVQESSTYTFVVHFSSKVERVAVLCILEICRACPPLPVALLVRVSSCRACESGMSFWLSPPFVGLSSLNALEMCTP